MRVFITGSSRGIGFGIAKAFRESGHDIILNGKTDEARLADSAGILDAAKYSADVGNFEAASRVFKDIELRGGLDVLVNCAGSEQFGLFQDTAPLEWEAVMRDNFYTVLNTCRLAVPGMVRRKRGVIINVSSVWGITGASCESVYAAAKGAVNIFTKSLAKELAPSGIRVNAIACGAFETRMNGRLSEDERRDFTENIPLGRFGLPDEAGKLAVFLASEGASYLTGQIIPLDGGLM